MKPVLGGGILQNAPNLKSMAWLAIYHPLIFHLSCIPSIFHLEVMFSFSYIYVSNFYNLCVL